MKTQKLLLSLLILTIFIQTNSCKKTSIVALYNTEFPNNIGTNWKYKVYDSINSILDTITIKIIGTTNLDNGDAASIWSINSLLNGTDTNYVTNKSDGIRIYPDKLLTASPKKNICSHLM